MRSRRYQAAPLLALALLAAGFALSPATGRAAPITLAIHLEPERIGLGETATLTIEARGGLVPLGFEPSFELDNFERLGGPSQFESMEVVNGLFSRSLRLSWRLRPLGIGPARVRAVKVAIRDRVVQMPEQTIQVQEAPTGGEPQEDSPFGEDDPLYRMFGGNPFGPPGARPGELQPQSATPQPPPAFLRAELSDERPFVGEQVLYTVYLYARTDVSMVNPVALPEFRGFWVRDVQLPDRLPTEIVGVSGQRYGRIPLLRKILFPLHAGSLRLEPVRYQIAANEVERVFFSPPISRPRQLDLATPPAALEVRPLPSAPPGFQGAVGPLALNAQLAPRDLAVGEAATLKVRISGLGHLDGMAAPELTVPPGLRIFPPHERTNDQLEGNRVRGERTWTYVLVPDRPGDYRLDLPAIPYFDAAAGTYRQATAPPIELAARPRASIATADLGPLHPVRPATAAPSMPAAAGLAARLGKPHVLVWLFSAPWLLALVAGLARRRRGLAGQGAAARRFEDRIASARGEDRPRRAAAAFEEAWGNLLAERFDLPSELPAPVWGRSLAEEGADPRTLSEITRLADDLQYLRSAPQLSSAESLRDELAERSLRIARALR
ncbi:MAG TPA: BatD family protein [Thermoanaerobaculia bacterium]|nr:BatD family protein [Thermoanaerobaculia bacterium]